MLRSATWYGMPAPLSRPSITEIRPGWFVRTNSATCGTSLVPSNEGRPDTDSLDLTSVSPVTTLYGSPDEVMNHGDLSAIDDSYAPRFAPVARRWVEPFLTSFSDVRMRIVELIAEGETVVGRLTCSGTHTGTWLGHPATGRRFTDVAEVYFFRVSGGRIVRAWGLEDTAERLRQLGLSTGVDTGRSASE